MVGFYKHDIPAWMDGTEALSDGAYRAYHVIVQLIMLNEGPIALNERGLAGRCNQTLKLFLRHLDELVQAGKLVVADGRIRNKRASQELDSVRKNRENAGKGGKISGERRKTPADFENEAAKSLENNNQDEATLHNDRSLKEKRREDTPIVPKGTEPEGFAEFRASYPKRSTAFPATQARKRWLEARKRGAEPAEIIAGAKAYAAEQQRIGKVGTEFVQTADVWLNKQRWRDYAEAGPAPKLFSEPVAAVPDDVWRDRVRIWRARSGYWPWRPSPPPDDPCTAVPRHILAEFGLSPRSQVAA
ncbi:DUF1376 domain-containing protein [Methylorubrum populi]|uniref:DUF1376 domain-containing protein n=1 Tax=Methylorubrum populi TaxID=223967 RepID=UPI0031F8AE3D